MQVNVKTLNNISNHRPYLSTKTHFLQQLYVAVAYIL